MSESERTYQRCVIRRAEDRAPSRAVERIRKFFLWCMEQSDVNSRFIYFSQGMVGAAGMLVLVVAFVFSTNRDSYPDMMLALGGVTGAAGLARFLAKKGGVNDTSNSDSSPTS